MKIFYLFIALVGALFLSGCDKQTQLNVQEINSLTQKMFANQQEQARELAALKAQMAVLPVQMDKTLLDYFVKSQEKALFYQTNALFLLLAVDKKIQSQFDLAAEGRELASRQAHAFHTNENELIIYCTAQTAAAIAAQEKRITDNLGAEIRRASTTLGTDLTNQFRQLTADTLAADKSDATRLQAIQADLTRMQRDLDLLKARLAATNPVGDGLH